MSAQPAKSKHFEYRFAVGSLNGDRSGSWKIWSKKNDIYLVARTIGAAIKTSLHESGACHSGYLTEYYETLDDKVLEKIPSRFLEKWQGGVSLGPGLLLKYRIRIPASDLRTFTVPKSEKKLHWFTPPPSTHDFIMYVVTEMPGVAIPGSWPGKNTGTQLAGQHVLPDGRTLWLVYQYGPTMRISNWENLCHNIMTQTGVSFAQMPQTFGPEHRIVIGYTDDKDGGHGNVEVAADRLNKPQAA